MPLTPNDDIVKTASAKALASAKADDQRHRLHGENATSQSMASPYFNKWVREFLEPVIVSKPKLKQVKKQFIWPPVSVELVDEISDMASAVHYAEDRYINVNLVDVSLNTDWEEYAERIDIGGFVSRDCHNALFTSPNSFVVVDLPGVQVTAFPEPYVYLMNVDKVRSCKPMAGTANAGLMEFVWFNTDVEGVTALFDTKEVALWKQATGGGLWEEVIGSRKAHNMPFCPAFKMWADVDALNPLCSNTMIRPILGLLDRLIFWDAGRESNDLATAFMMFWHLERTKPNAAITSAIIPATGGPIEVDGPPDCKPTGILEGVPYQPTTQTCPTDTGNDPTTYGPGTTLPIPAPQNKEDADLRPPAGFIAPDVNNLKYVGEKVDALREKCRTTATGYEAPQNKQAINRDQVASILERSKLIYKWLAEYNEILLRRVIELIARGRYGPYYKGKTVNLGRRVSMLTGDQIAVLYKLSKDAGFGDWLLEELGAQAKEYYGRSDASRRLRFKMLRDLNGLSNYTPTELRTLGVDLADPDGYRIAVHLMRFVYRFERENDLKIEQFGDAPDYNNRIEAILKRFKEYGSEFKPVETDNGDEATTGGNTGKSGGKSTKRGKSTK